MALKIGVILDTASGVPQSVKDTQVAIDKIQKAVNAKPLNLRFKISEKEFSVASTIQKASASAKELKAAIAAVTAEMGKLESEGAFSKRGGKALLEQYQNNLKYLQLMLSGSTNAYANYYAEQAKFNAKQESIVAQRELMAQAEVQILRTEANSLEMLAAQIQAASSQLQTMPGGPAFQGKATKKQVAAYQEMINTLTVLRAKYDRAEAAMKEMEAVAAMGDGTIKRNEVTIKSLQATLSALKAGMESINLETEANVRKFYELGGMMQRVSAVMREYQTEFMRATTATGSLDRINGELAAINAEWNAMSESERKSSERAKLLLANYKKLTGELENEALSLSQIVQKEKEREARQKKLEEMTAKRKAQLKYEDAILKNEAKTIKMLNEQIRILTSRKMTMVIGSKEFTETDARIEALQTRLDQLNGKVDKTGLKAKRNLKEINSELNVSASYVGRLLIRLGLYSGIFSAFRAVRHIREVTAEFEMQRVALGGIIQNTYKAEQLFQQIKAAAVKSPFEIKDLVSYTKQLSAYRIETDKLFDVTMRLADVSSGLGVDMSRLILAYGQVRAASVLRGQELRQFTESGVPLVELLAKKFSDLRGELVSTGEVFELISKRQVPFEMIAEIFEDMTNKGGIFYKMQERQAQTLKGQWMNLKDAVSIMYDEIGNTTRVNSAMTSIIGTLKEMAQNWEHIASSVNGFAITAAILKATSLAVKVLTVDTKLLDKATQRANYSRMIAEAGQVRYARNMRLSAFYMYKAANATNFYRRILLRFQAALLTINPIMLAISAAAVAIGVIVKVFSNANKEAKEFANTLKEINAETGARSESMTRNFVKLADTIASSNSTLKERQDALEELNRTYADYLPNLTQEDIEVAKQTNNYKTLVKAIKEKIRIQGIEEKINKAQEIYKGNISNAKDTITSALKSSGISVDDIVAFWGQIEDQMENGVKASVETMLDTAESIGGKDLANKFKKALGVSTTVDPFSGATYKASKFNDEILKLNTSSRKLAETLKELNAELSATGIGGKLGAAYESMITNVFDKLPNVKGVAEETKQAQQRIASLIQYIRYAFAVEGISLPDAITGGDIDFKKLFAAIDGKLHPTLLKAIEQIQKDYQKIVPSTNLARLSKEVFTKIADDAGANIDRLKSYFYEDEQDVDAWVKEVKEGYEDAQKSVQRYRSELADTEKAGKDTTAIKQDLNDAKRMEEALRMMYEWAKKYTIEKTKASGSSSDAELQRVKEEVKLIEKMYNKYKEYVKLIGSDKAVEKVREQFKGVIDTLQFKPTDFSPADVAKLYRSYKDALGSGTSQRKEYGLELEFNAENIDWETFKKSLTDELEQIKKDIAHTETAKNFFNDILAQTGDAAVARSITVSIYGEVGDDLSDSMIKQVEKTFAGVDVSGAIDKSIGRIDYSKLRGMIPQLPEDMRKAAEEIVSNGEKSNAEWIKDLMKTYEKAKTLEEQLTIIRTREAQKRAEIQQKVSDPKERESLTAASYEYEGKEVAKIQAEFLKNSPLWAKTFEDIEKVGVKSLDILIARLEKFIELYGSKLPANELRALVKELDKLKDAQVDANPWKGIKEGFKDAIDGIKQYKEAMKELEAITPAERAQHDNYGKLSDDLMQQIAQEKAKLNTMNTNDPGYEKQAADIRILETRLKSLTSTYERVENAELQSANGSGKFKVGIKKIGDSVNAISSSLTAFKNLFDSITSLFELEEDSEAAIAINGISDAFTTLVAVLGVVAAALTVVDIIAKQLMVELWPLLVIGAALAAIVAVVKILSNMKAKKLQEQIDALQESVDDLEDAFDRLENKMEDVFGTDYIDNYTKRIEALKAEVEAYTKMADLERQKGKKADQEKVDDYMKSATEARDKIVEMQDELAERMTGTTLSDAAKDFAESWVDAYISFSSTTAAMKEKFNDMVKNMVVQSMAAKLIQNILEPIFKQIDEMAESGGELTAEEIAIISGQIPAKIGEINTALNGMMSQLAEAGINLRAGQSNLTGISRDIASASEESILGLAAGINTQNFYISGIYTSVNQILALLQGGPVNTATASAAGATPSTGEYLSYLPNIAQNTADMVAECKAAAAECRATNELLNRVIKPKGSASTHVVMTNV